jgi:hypothetical protein
LECMGFVLGSVVCGLAADYPEILEMTIITLQPAKGTISLAPVKRLITLDSPWGTTITNYSEFVTLVNQNGGTLVNENGDSLVVSVVRAARTNVIFLGA